MVSVRRAEIQDLGSIMDCNQQCLRENYSFKYFLQHGLLWQSIQSVSEDLNTGKIIGYVMARQIEEEENDIKYEHGHITSVSVLRSHRKLGAASNLLQTSQFGMDQIYGYPYVSLNVRVSNRAAVELYRKLNYQITMNKPNHYEDGEEAYYMRKYFNKQQLEKEANNL